MEIPDSWKTKQWPRSLEIKAQKMLEDYQEKYGIVEINDWLKLNRVWPSHGPQALIDTLHAYDF